MYRPNFVIKDKQFSIEKILQYSLIVQLEYYRLRIVCIDLSTNRCVALETYEWAGIDHPADHWLAVQQFFEQHHFLSHLGWQKAIFCFDNQLFTLVPHTLFDQASKEIYLKFATEIGSEKVVHCAYTPLEIVIIFGIPHRFASWLTDRYGTSMNFIHQAHTLLPTAWLYKQTYLKKANAMPLFWVTVETRLVHIVVIGEEGLLYYNRFSYDAVGELLQYVLMVMKSLRFDFSLQQVTLAGLVSSGSVVHKTFRSYIRHVKIIEKPPVDLQFGWSFTSKALAENLDILSFYPAALYGKAFGFATL